MGSSAKSAPPQPDAPRETELKLEADPEALRQVLSDPRWAGAAPESRKSLRAVYFDTPAGALRKAGLTLRVREEGGHRVQAVKVREASLVGRQEWEWEIDGAEPDLALVGGTALAPLLADGAVRDAIGPAFRVEVERVTRRLAVGDARIELAVDDGRVIAGERSASFAELELELEQGAPGDLFRLALALAEAASLRLGLRTKAERGYALLAEAGPKVLKAEALHLDPAMSSAEAFQAVARNCLRQIVGNEAVLRASREADAVHQMRVGLRRLRAALTLFRPMLKDGEFEGVRSSLRSMAGALGAARDLDVFIASTLEPALAREPDEPGLKTLIADYRRRRDEVYDETVSAVDSAGFRRGVLAAASWIETGPWLTDPELDDLRRTPIVEQAAAILDKRWKRVKRRGRGLVRMSEAERHEVRIEVKKLRYAVEFFGGLFGGAKAQRRAVLDALQSLQASLGDLNDIAVGADLARAPVESAAEAGLLASLLRREGESRRDVLLAQAKAAFRDLKTAEPFWRQDD